MNGNFLNLEQLTYSTATLRNEKGNKFKTNVKRTTLKCIQLMNIMSKGNDI